MEGKVSFCREQRRANIIFTHTPRADRREARPVAMAEDEQIIKAPPEAVKKGGYCMIRGMPCKLEICEVLPKATANGNKRLHIRGPNVFTGKLYEDTLNLTAGFHGIDVPVTVKAQYSLMDVDSDTGFLSLLTDSGDCKEDVGLVKIGWELRRAGSRGYQQV